MEHIERKWKPIEGYEGIYDLRDDGLLYSHPRPHCCGGYTYGSNNGNGYLHFTLLHNGNYCSKRVHNLVWETFVGQIPEGYDVHHINHNSQDNRLENLCLLEKHKHRKMHLDDSLKTKVKPVIQYTLDGQFVAEYPSISEASKQTGINSHNITSCCTGKRKSAGGSIWKYK